MKMSECLAKADSFHGGIITEASYCNAPCPEGRRFCDHHQRARVESELREVWLRHEELGRAIASLGRLIEEGKIRTPGA